GIASRNLARRDAYVDRRLRERGNVPARSDFAGTIDPRILRVHVIKPFLDGVDLILRSPLLLATCTGFVSRQSPRAKTSEHSHRRIGLEHVVEGQVRSEIRIANPMSIFEILDYRAVRRQERVLRNSPLLAVIFCRCNISHGLMAFLCHWGLVLSGASPLSPPHRRHLDSSRTGGAYKRIRQSGVRRSVAGRGGDVLEVPTRRKRGARAG